MYMSLKHHSSLFILTFFRKGTDATWRELLSQRSSAKRCFQTPFKSLIYKIRYISFAQEQSLRPGEFFECIAHERSLNHHGMNDILANSQNLILSPLLPIYLLDVQKKNSFLCTLISSVEDIYKPLGIYRGIDIFIKSNLRTEILCYSHLKTMRYPGR